MITVVVAPTTRPRGVRHLCSGRQHSIYIDAARVEGEHRTNQPEKNGSKSLARPIDDGDRDVYVRRAEQEGGQEEEEEEEEKKKKQDLHDGRRRRRRRWNGEDGVLRE